jgi:broad specificity phosphatase PhoE
MARKVYIVAHGETKIDREGRIHGHLDPPLTLAGQLTARKQAKQLKGKGIEKIYSSPRKRATETAQALAKETGAPIEVRDELIPWRLGSMSGAKTNSIKPLIDFFSSRPNRPIPGGEAKSEVLGRYRKFVSELRKGKGNVAIAGHSQHTLGFDYASRGGDAGKVPMIGGQAGEVKEVSL